MNKYYWLLILLHCAQGASIIWTLIEIFQYAFFGNFNILAPLAILLTLGIEAAWAAKEYTDREND